MKTTTYAHYTDQYLLNPTNPVTVNLIGAGGTGSSMLTGLVRIHQAMLALNYPGLMVNVYDDDTVSPANLGRQLFFEAELGMNKGVALINRVNRAIGTNWKAVPHRYDEHTLKRRKREATANIYISCVDTAKSRFEIADLLQPYTYQRSITRNRPIYWLDLGNNKTTGQALLSTIGELKQPQSEKYQAIGKLPFVTDTFKNLLRNADNSDNTPSCSLAEALTKQDLFINSTLANLGGSLLWSLFREGVMFNKGFFLNLADFRVQPIKVDAFISPQILKAA